MWRRQLNSFWHTKLRPRAGWRVWTVLSNASGAHISQTSRTANQLVRYGVSLRSDVRRLDKAMAHLAEVHAETDEKLNALIDWWTRPFEGTEDEMSNRPKGGP